MLRKIKKIFMYLFSCKHKNLGWFVKDKKICIDCGMERKFDYKKSKFIGEWKRYA